jgi:NTP pyrophosphatase (non-canonical NTP hydrolase)
MSEFLDSLRAANIQRDKEALGNCLQSWTERDWACLFAGEAGELVGAISDAHRGKPVVPEDIADEAADVLVCLDLLCAAHDIDLIAATQKKFEAVSKKVGSRVFLPGLHRPEVIRLGIEDVDKAANASATVEGT